MPINRAFQRLKKPRKDGFFGRLEVEMKGGRNESNKSD